MWEYFFCNNSFQLTKMKTFIVITLAGVFFLFQSSYLKSAVLSLYLVISQPCQWICGGETMTVWHPFMCFKRKNFSISFHRSPKHHPFLHPAHSLVITIQTKLLCPNIVPSKWQSRWFYFSHNSFLFFSFFFLKSTSTCRVLKSFYVLLFSSKSVFSELGHSGNGNTKQRQKEICFHFRGSKLSFVLFCCCCISLLSFWHMLKVQHLKGML